MGVSLQPGGEPAGTTSARGRAARWWIEPDRRAVSTRFEARQTEYFAQVAATVVLRAVDGPIGCVLDVGCGPGRVLAAVAARSPGARLVGIDPDPVALTEARHRLGPTDGVTLLAGRAEEFADTGPDGLAARVAGPVHAATVLLNLALWTERSAPLRALVDLLEPGGALLVLDLVAPTDEATRHAWTSLAADVAEADYLADQMAAWPSAADHAALAGELARHPRGVSVQLATCPLFEVGAGEPPWIKPPFPDLDVGSGPRAALLLVRTPAQGGTR